jgi:hypothetical protein
MRKISTGQDSTLGTYLGIAKVLGPKAEAFVQKKIDEHEKGAEEEVITEESQMLYLLSQIEFGEGK